MTGAGRPITALLELRQSNPKINKHENLFWRYLTFFFLGTTHGQHGVSGVLVVSPAEELGPSQGRGTVSDP